MEYSLSIVIPCFNPRQHWLETVLASYREIQKIEPATELIIVNDGSTQNFPHITATQLNAIASCTCISYPKNEGKGFALRQGVAASSGNFVIYTDVDFPYTQESLAQILQTLKAGADVAVGIRSKAYYNAIPKSRAFISKILRFFIRTMLAIPTDDTQCGLKGFNQKGKAAFMQTTIKRYLFDMEFVKLAALQQLQIKLCEVHLKPGVEMAAMPVKILLQEFSNFIKIYFKKITV